MARKMQLLAEAMELGGMTARSIRGKRMVSVPTGLLSLLMKTDGVSGEKMSGVMATALFAVFGDLTDDFLNTVRRNSCLLLVLSHHCPFTPLFSIYFTTPLRRLSSVANHSQMVVNSLPDCSKFNCCVR